MHQLPGSQHNQAIIDQTVEGKRYLIRQRNYLEASITNGGNHTKSPGNAPNELTSSTSFLRAFLSSYLSSLSSMIIFSHFFASFVFVIV